MLFSNVLATKGEGMGPGRGYPPMVGTFWKFWYKIQVFVQYNVEIHLNLPEN